MKITFTKFTHLLSWSVIIAVIIVCLLIYLPIPQHWSFESKAELEKIRTELSLAEARWKNHNITDYDIDVQVFVHLGWCNTDFEGKPTTLSVRQGKLVITDEVRKYHLEEEGGCHVSEFLPPKLFDTTRQILEESEPDIYFLMMEFDSEYGFLVKYDLTANNRISDLNVHYIFSNFRPKTP